MKTAYSRRNKPENFYFRCPIEGSRAALVITTDC